MRVEGEAGVAEARRRSVRPEADTRDDRSERQDGAHFVDCCTPRDFPLLLPGEKERLQDQVSGSTGACRYKLRIRR